MSGGTSTFVTDGIGPALERAGAAAGDGNVASAGGATPINRYLAAGLVDELRLHVVPFTAGVGGPQTFDGLPPTDVEAVAVRHTPHITHLTYRRR